MNFQSLEKFMKSELSEELMSRTFAGKIPVMGSTQGGEVCLAANEMAGTNTSCLSYASDMVIDGLTFYEMIEDVDKPC